MKKEYVFWWSLLVFTIIIVAQTSTCLYRNGMLIYPLDDSYIHMSIAKNIANHGVWGVTKFEFSSASSSIFYTLLLSLLFKVFGISTWIPLIFNWLAAAAILYFISNWTTKYLSSWGSFLFTVGFILVVPISTITMIGMEHTLHVLLSLLFVYLSWKYFSGDRVQYSYFLVAILLVATRYEGIFLVGIVALIWIFILRRMSTGAALLLAIVVPVFSFGIYSMMHGGYFLPNSLIIKGADASHSIVGFLTDKIAKFFESGVIYALLFFPCIYFILFPIQKGDSIRYRPIHLIFLAIGVACLAHFIFARFGRPYRYGAYLVAMELMMLPLVVTQFIGYFKLQGIGSKIVLMVLFCIYLLPVLSRLGVSFITNRCINNIHDQQIEMAFFIRDYFPKATVALNDIGAVAFYNDNVHIFDIVGLSNADVLRFHDNKDTTFLGRFTRKDGVQMAFVYPTWIKWLGYRMPTEWQLVGSWTLKNNYIAGNPCVGIFAAQPDLVDTLSNALRAYSYRLPNTVLQSGRYMDGGAR